MERTMSLSGISIWTAKHTPRFIKSAVHRMRFLDRAVMGMYGSMVGGQVITIPDGPMQGIKLAASSHTSHSHLDGTYERQVQQAIDSMLKPGDVCYDLGASIGYMTLLMARKAKEVYAFEPAPHAVDEMKRHLAANGLTNVTVVPSPVSNEVRQVRFCLTDVAFGSAINENETRWPVLNLETTTLDLFTKDHPAPDFLKMDVEGEEGRVLEGASNLLALGKTRICAELHNREAAQSVLGTLKRFGYTIKLLDGSPAEVPDHVLAGEFHVMAWPAQRT